MVWGRDQASYLPPTPPGVIQLAQHHLWQRSFMPPPQQCCRISHAHICWVYFWALYSSLFYLSILHSKFFTLSWWWLTCSQGWEPFTWEFAVHDERSGCSLNASKYVPIKDFQRKNWLNLGHGKNDARTKGKAPVEWVGKLGNRPEAKTLRAIHPPLHSLPSPPVDLQIPSSQSAQKETNRRRKAFCLGHWPCLRKSDPSCSHILFPSCHSTSCN